MKPIIRTGYIAVGPDGEPDEKFFKLPNGWECRFPQVKPTADSFGPDHKTQRVRVTIQAIKDPA